MLNKRWELKSCLKTNDNIDRYEGFTELATAVLNARGFKSADEAQNFLATELSGIHSPFLLRDMDKACETIKRAVSKGKKIVVYGDYDVDGITATYLLCDYLTAVGADCEYMIPDRVQNGYGMTRQTVDEMRKMGAELIITVDNGITAAEETDYAHELGIEVVITDHHECPCQQNARLPEAQAVVNPCHPEDSYPFKKLAGVGVAFKLVCALDGDTNKVLDKYCDILAVGTIADVMEVVDENRIFVEYGLRKLPVTENLGLEALLKLSGADNRRISSGTINYIIAPRINAAGRMTNAKCAVELFRAVDPTSAREFAMKLCELNSMRQASENELIKQVNEMLEKQGFFREREKAIVLWSEGWCGGIVGIVCSRLMCAYGVPVVLLTVEDGIAKGSGRSLEGFNLYEAFSELSDCLEKFGGHALAAGLTILPERLPEFRERFLAYAEKIYENKDIQPVLRIDSEVRARTLNIENIEGLEKLEPYGNGWLQPIFSMFGVRLLDVYPVGNNKHLRLTIEKCGVTLTAMLFNMSPDDFVLKRGDFADIAFTLDTNIFRNEKQIQIVISDIRPCESAGISGYQLYTRFVTGEKLTRCEKTCLRPQREDFIAVWRFLIAKVTKGVYRASPGEINLDIRRYERRDITAAKLYVCLAVFDETGLIKHTIGDSRIAIYSVNRGEKVKIDIEKSNAMRMLSV